MPPSLKVAGCYGEACRFHFASLFSAAATSCYAHKEDDFACSCLTCVRRARDIEIYCLTLIGGPIVESPSGAVEVTIDFDKGRQRWCFFTTPQHLAAVGDWIDVTHIRVQLGASHMIVVGEVSKDIIDRVLRQLYTEGQLEAHTIPLA